MADELTIKGAAEKQTSSEVVDRQRSPSEEGEERDEAPPNVAQPPLPDEEEPPLPDELPPPLPDEAPPQEQPKDDGWEAKADPSTGAWYFYNRFTGLSQWENPRIPDVSHSQHAVGTVAPGTEQDHAVPNSTEGGLASPPGGVYMGYNPKIHGDFDPNADYAQFHKKPEAQVGNESAGAEGMIGSYEQEATFNRFTGKFQSGAGNQNSEYHNDENKSNRQMNAFFDVDRAANAHEGKSLKAERSGQRLSKKEVKEFNDKRRARKEQKRRDFLLS